MSGSTEEGMVKLRSWLRKSDIPQVDDCETDYDVIVLTIRVMDAMTKAYKTVADMVEMSMGVADDVEDARKQEMAAQGKAAERAARAAVHKQQRGGRDKGSKRRR